MDDLILADLVGLWHGLFVLFVVGGQCLILIGWLSGWSWTRVRVFRLLHLAAICFVVLESWFAIPCPLTIIEADLRDSGAEISFIGYWLDRLLYFQAPTWVFTTLYSLFGCLVVMTFFFYPPRRGD
ncbi:MAG: DUF2784 domain-containing protein [Rhodospirillaceae bacterium]|jgi:hypothetical protein|nr:DUF2784 domain-containing protein [Rhodospirillaceae bacterium]MBT5243248.1 DUF2784 domain-containing protein [Rhodospirillaceae bacterium]MBT5563968.1 DUF2784 domain-containing protein [Rhodospirillaceae bacterium]MBT6240828.1 DUF2784 domain-containing protein [Rhodospirillaceae bacterium]